jgi:hypothetical protein
VFQDGLVEAICASIFRTQVQRSPPSDTHKQEMTEGSPIHMRTCQGSAAISCGPFRDNVVLGLDKTLSHNRNSLLILVLKIGVHHCLKC